MSSRNYTVTVNVKDGGMLRKLEALQSSSPSGGRGGGGTVASSGGIFNKLESLGIGQLAKLAGIGLSVGSLVALTVKSSGMLQGVLKLWETGFMLIFKPIGDFVALALRPLAMMMLLFAIPYYKTVGAWFREHGVAFGKFVAGLATNPIQTINVKTDPINLDIISGVQNLVTTLMQMWDKFVSDAWNTLMNVPPMLWGFFVSIGEGIWQRLSSIPSIFYGYLSSIGSMIWDGLASIPDVFMGIFTGLATSLTETLAGVPKAIYDAIVGWIQSLIGGGSAGGNIPGGNSSRFTRQRTTTAAVADTLE